MNINIKIPEPLCHSVGELIDSAKELINKVSQVHDDLDVEVDVQEDGGHHENKDQGC